jgi:hypothetical protein
MRLSTLNGVSVHLRLVAGRVVAVVFALEDIETEGLAAGRPLRFSGAGDSKARGGKCPNGEMWGDGPRSTCPTVVGGLAAAGGM